jgi:hypothetical protein
VTKPLPFTKAAIRRAIAAAAEAGAAGVEVLPDGTIRVVLCNDYELVARNQSAQTDDADEWGQVQA